MDRIGWVALRMPAYLLSGVVEVDKSSRAYLIPIFCALLEAAKVQLLVALDSIFRRVCRPVLTYDTDHVLFVIERPVPSNPQFLQRTA